MRVVIVGAGIIGLACAEALTRERIEVLLVERNQHPGQEASWAAAGILPPYGEAKQQGPFLELLRLGFSLFPESVARLTHSTGIDISYRVSGMLTLAFTESDENQLREQYRWQKEAGLSLEWITPSQIQSMEPALDTPTRGGIWDPQTAQLDCRRLIEAYTQTVEHQGGALFSGEPVTQFLVAGDRVTGVKTSKRVLEADWVVNCAGSWAGFDRALTLSIPTIPVRGQLLQYRTQAPLFQRVVRSPRAYLVQRGPQALIAGTTVEYAGFEKEVTDEGRRSIEAGIRELSSQTACLCLETSWAGLRPGTPDGLPLLGSTPIRNLLLATGHFRNGILLAPLTGKIIADWILKRRCSIDLSAFSADRFLAQATRKMEVN